MNQTHFPFLEKCVWAPSNQAFEKNFPRFLWYESAQLIRMYMFTLLCASQSYLYPHPSSEMLHADLQYLSVVVWNWWVSQLNSAEWKCGLSRTRWLGLTVGLYFNPPATTWLIDNAIRQHHVVLILRSDVKNKHWQLFDVMRQKKAHLLRTEMQFESFDVQCHCGVEYCVNLLWILHLYLSLMISVCLSSYLVDSLMWQLYFFVYIRWLCYCVPGENKPRGALCPEEDVRQQWAWSAGVQTGDSDYGEWFWINVFIVCSHALLFVVLVKPHVRATGKAEVFRKRNTCRMTSSSKGLNLVQTG